MSEALIAGVDPGSTSAVAALNLDKELVLLESDREFPADEIILKLIQKGHTVLVGCDTESMPSLADEIASSLDARKFSPDEDISRERKRSLGSEGDNSHEKDAIAAAVHTHTTSTSAGYRKLMKRQTATGRREENWRRSVSGTGSGHQRYELGNRRFLRGS